MTPPRWIAMFAVFAALSSRAPEAPAAPPRVAVAWPAGPMEARVAFAEAVDPSVATGAVGTKIGFEDPAAAGRPGGNRGTLRVAAARLEDGGRTLVLVTDPHPREASYALALAGVKAPGEAGAGGTVDVQYDLSGVEAAWSEGPNPDPAAPPAWSGWWPDLDPERTRELTKGSAGHDRLWGLAGRPGRLTLRAYVLLPQGRATLALDAGAPFEATLAGESARSVAGPDKGHKAALKAEGIGEAVELTVVLATGDGAAPRLRAAILSGPDLTQGRPLNRSALVLPWAPPTPSNAAPPDVPQALLVGGDPAKGEANFRGDVAKCANCHAIRGQGGAIGPDLGYLAGADRAWVYQNIAEPSAAIHPDYVSYTVALKDGRVAMGVVRAEGADALKVGDIDARQTVIPRADVEELRPSASSIMPVGLLGALGEEGTRDLLAFLTAPAPKPSARTESPH